MGIDLLDHPLGGHLLATLRDSRTSPHEFRRASKTLTLLLVLKATQTIRTEMSSVETPLGTAAVRLLGQGLAIVPVLRAGLGMLDPILDLFPDVAVGYVGLERNEETAEARSYYQKLPTSVCDRFCLCVDPMLATGGSASQAISLIKANGAHNITMVCVVAAPEGAARLNQEHPDVPIVAAGLDERLTEKKYIFPGLGDYGDRLFGTP